MLFGREAILPPVPGAEAFDPRGPQVTALSAVSAGIVLVQVAIFVGFIVAAILYRRLYVRDENISDGFLSAGLVVAAFGQLHFALDPVVATGIVTSTDALRLGFYAILLMGIIAELGVDYRALRGANAELRRLRDVDAANAALAERSRLAREIHDGLAQDLWYAKLKQGRLTQSPSLDGRRGRPPARSSTPSTPRWPRLARRSWRCAWTRRRHRAWRRCWRSYVEDFADRFGVRAEFEAEGTLPAAAATDRGRGPAHRPGGTEQRAAATRTRPSSAFVPSGQDRSRAISVTDNGRGFDPSAVPPGTVRPARDARTCGAGRRHRWTSGRDDQDGTRITVEVTTEEAVRA